MDPKTDGDSRGLVVVIGKPKVRWIGSLLGVVVATALGFITSAVAAIQEVRGSPYRIASDVLVFSPDGRWLATLETDLGPDRRRLWVMSVDTTKGVLQPVAGAPFMVGSIPSAVAFSPDSRLLAVSTGRSVKAGPRTILVFSMDRRTGALHRLSQWSDPMGPVNSIAFSPRRGLLAAEDQGSKALTAGVSLLTVNRTTGALRYASRWVGSNDMYPIFLSSGEMSFSPRGNLLALLTTATGSDRDGVAIFSVKQRTLTLAAHARLPSEALAGNLAFNPNGRLLAIGDSGYDNVLVLRVNDRTGALHAVPGSPFGTGSTPDALAFSPDGLLLAVVNGDDQDFSLFSVSKRTGSLRRVSGSPFGRSVSPFDTANWVAFSPRGNLLAYGTGLNPPSSERQGGGGEKVAIFSTVSCADPDQDDDCDSS